MKLPLNISFCDSCQICFIGQLNSNKWSQICTKQSAKSKSAGNYKFFSDCDHSNSRSRSKRSYSTRTTQRKGHKTINQPPYYTEHQGIDRQMSCLITERLLHSTTIWLHLFDLAQWGCSMDRPSQKHNQSQTDGQKRRAHSTSQEALTWYDKLKAVLWLLQLLNFMSLAITQAVAYISQLRPCEIMFRYLELIYKSKAEAQRLQNYYRFRKWQSEDQVLLHDMEEESLSNVRHNWKPFKSSVENSNWHHSIMQLFERNKSASCHQRMSKSDKLSVHWHLHHTITALIEMWSTLFITEFLIIIQMLYSLPSSFSAT